MSCSACNKMRDPRFPSGPLSTERADPAEKSNTPDAMRQFEQTAPQKPCVSAGVYVHFPWCLAKCPYCDFVSYGRPAASLQEAGEHERYADAVLRELERRAPSVHGRRIESVFFG